jgi:hypothetical protein
MSSAPAQRGWRLEFESRCAPFLDPLMGWTGSRDPLRQVALTFPTLDAALSYSERQGLCTVVQHDAQSRADQRDLAKRAFSDGTLRRLGLGQLQDRYDDAMADASRAVDEPRREAGDSPPGRGAPVRLSVDEKRSILMNWAFDQYLMQQRQPDATAETQLSQIEQAFVVLEGGPAGRRALTIPRAAPPDGAREGRSASRSAQGAVGNGGDRDGDHRDASLPDGRGIAFGREMQPREKPPH